MAEVYLDVLIVSSQCATQSSKTHLEKL